MGIKFGGNAKGKIKKKETQSRTKNSYLWSSDLSIMVSPALWPQLIKKGPAEPHSDTPHARTHGHTHAKWDVIKNW